MTKLLNQNIYNNFLHVHYKKLENDTCYAEYVNKLIQNIYDAFRSYIPDLLDDYSIHIYNSSLADAPKKSFSFKNKQIIINSNILEKEDISWEQLIAKSMAFIYLDKIKFQKNNFLKKKWLSLRINHDEKNPHNTAVEDFMNLFGILKYSEKTITNIDPDTILGLRSLLLIWHPILKSRKITDLILYHRFVSVPKANFLGYIFINLDLKTRKTSWNKITSQGYWTYSEHNDQWILTEIFR